MGTKILRKVALFSTTALMTANMAYAQDAATVATEEAEASIVVTGSRIQGAQINDVLPVTVLDEQQIAQAAQRSHSSPVRRTTPRPHGLPPSQPPLPPDRPHPKS